MEYVRYLIVCYNVSFHDHDIDMLLFDLHLVEFLTAQYKDVG